MRKVCALEDNSGDEYFPKWYRKLFAKHQGEKDKAQFITTTIEKYYIFKNVEVPLYLTLVKTIVNRDWTASNIRKIAALVNATILFSPFSMVESVEDDMVIMQQYHKYIINAYLVSTSELKYICKKLTAKTPK